METITEKYLRGLKFYDTKSCKPFDRTHLNEKLWEELEKLTAYGDRLQKAIADDSLRVGTYPEQLADIEKQARKVCLSIVEKSSVISNGNYTLREPSTEEFKRMALSFSLERGEPIHKGSKKKAGIFIFSETYKVPDFEIVSNLEHPNEVKVRTLFDIEGFV